MEIVMNKLFPFLILLSACAPSEEKFEEKNYEITCELIFECTAEEDIQAAKDLSLWFFGEDVEECTTILNDTASEASDDTAVTSELVYDKKAAKECLAELEALTCDDFSDSTVSAPACENVYTEAE